MKLMKHIMIALVLCAIPAVAFGQTVSCDNCTHQLSVYMGSGGFVATHDDDMDAEKVTWVATCNGITRNGELEPDKDGTVRALLAGDLACHAEGGGSFRLGPVTDGGWFWLTREKSSAVGNLVALDLFDDKGMSVNEMAEITSAGDGVTMMAGKGAVYLEEAATGRVGILPTILPEPMMEEDPPAKCGFAGAGSGGNPYRRVVSDCMMGDGGVTVLATTYNALTGGTAQVTNGSSITRPGGTGVAEVTIDLWGNGTGHFTTSAEGVAAASPVPANINFLRGQKSVAMTPLRPVTRYTGVTYRAVAGSGPTAAGYDNNTAMGGITLSTDTANVAMISIAADPAHCSKTNNHTATVTVYADVAAGETGQAQVTPSIKVAGARANPTNPTQAGMVSFNVVCPAASANLGTDLVPENPFPTTE